ncbi:hypothetical protein PHJA_002898700 [Phtheirospermum japonicum]|uniref:AIPP2-like SPOC-like domain-containing protein n=1 Tax=Phtheirospermum japonicum TaxID=374723 RepID=A0A830DLB1_9LAMI|nr:hypothetical protein PHJA_002898700 [Phtheirospermum japonicum]
MSDVSPNDDNINWCCWDCAPEDSINKPLRKSERICPKRQKVLKTRNFWKGRLNQKNRPVHISNEVNEFDQSAIDRHSPIRGVEPQLLNEGQRDLDILSISEIPSHSKEHDKSIKINEPTFVTKDTLPVYEENNITSLGETRKIEEVFNHSDNSKDDGKIIDHHVPSLVASDHCISSPTLCRQPSLEPDDSISAEPVIDPKWRGWFNINEEEDETCEILAHLSNKACLKVSDAATAMPHMLDIQILDKHVVWPKRFTVSPPTAASIALYFFPSCERDERMYDSLLDEVIERELALMAMIDNVELLIFSSYELPLQHRRFNGKYFFWGVFRQKQSSHSPSETATASVQKTSEIENLGHSEPTDGANNKNLVHSKPADGLNSPSLHNLSPLSMNSSQASNLLSLKNNNTPDSLYFPPFKLSRLDKTSNGGSTQEEEKVGYLVEGENHYKSQQFYLRSSSPKTDNALAEEVV